MKYVYSYFMYFTHTHPYVMPSTNSKPAIRHRALQLSSCRTTAQFATLLRINVIQLQLMAAMPSYHHFQMRKKDGSLRQIEAPCGPLKKAQSDFSFYLQAVYYFIKSPAAYGYIISSTHDPAPRNILTNAEKHIGHPCLLNADLKDFFHDVKEDFLSRLFTRKPFAMDEQTAALAAALVCHKGRLPMGSPASPVLSNFALLAFDSDLLLHCAAHNITYTRFVDDMSFSGTSLPGRELYSYIVSVATKYGYRFNEAKLKVFGPENEKIVTGLILKSRLELPETFFSTLKKDCGCLRGIMEIKAPLGYTQDEPWLVLLRQQIEGRLALVGMVYGKQSSQYRQGAALYHQADNVPQSFYSNSWLDFPYCF